MRPQSDSRTDRLRKNAVSLAVAAFLALATPAAAPADRASDWRDEPAADRVPPTLAVLPTLRCSVATDLTLKIRVTDESGPGEVRLFVRGEHDADFRPVALTRHGSVFTARIGPTPSRGRLLGLYVEATDALGNGPALAGSAERPLEVELVDATERPVSALLAALGVVGAGLLLAIGDRLREARRRRRRARAREERFWAAIVAPFAGRTGTAFTDLLNRVCVAEVDHPVRGRVRLKRAEVLERLHRPGVVSVADRRG